MRTNCFGMLSRESGHSRAPAPPHLMTGTIRVGMSNSLGNGATSSLPGSKGQPRSGASVAQAGYREGREGATTIQDRIFA
jgi:hypothetical protein